MISAHFYPGADNAPRIGVDSAAARVDHSLAAAQASQVLAPRSPRLDWWASPPLRPKRSTSGSAGLRSGQAHQTSTTRTNTASDVLPGRVVPGASSLALTDIFHITYRYTIKSSVFCSRFSRGTLKAREFCSQGQGLLFMEAPCNGETVNLEGPGSPGKQKARRACVRRAQRMTRSRAREKKGQNGGADQSAGFGLRGG